MKCISIWISFERAWKDKSIDTMKCVLALFFPEKKESKEYEVLPEGTEGLSKGSEGLPEGPEGQLEGSQGPSDG